jgi:transposase
MGYNFLPYEQEQLLLLPPSMREWVAEGSLPRWLSAVVDELQQAGKLAAFYAPYRTDGWGRAAYHPVMMVKVVLYSYVVGVTSSRRIARALEGDVALRYLSGNQQPDFRTIAEFRQTHLAAFEQLFTQVLELCKAAGLVKLGTVALDGRKVPGNAALARNRTREQLEQAVQQILTEAEQVDAAEDQQYGRDRRGDELPEALRTRAGQLRVLRAAKARLEAAAAAEQQAQAAKIAEREQEEAARGRKKRGRKPKPPAEVVDRERKANLTDPESRILKTRTGWVQGYNGQAMAEVTSQVIVAQAVTTEENDVGQLGPMLACCEAQAGAQPEQLTADAGYWSEANATLVEDGPALFIATTKDWKQRKALRETGAPKGRIPKHLTVKERMERKLRTQRGRAVYRQRSGTIEPVFGQMVMRGLTRFLLRGYAKVKAEWSLWCSTHNLLKLYRAGWTATLQPS